MKILLVVGLAFISNVTVTAIPNGAISCDIGLPSPRGLHICGRRLCPRYLYIERNEEAGYQTILAGTPLKFNDTDPTFANIFQFGVENQLVIQSNTGNYFKGILVIASGGDTENVDILDTRTPQALTITDPVSTKESIGCENFNVSSVSHTEPSEKINLTMNFKWPTDGQKLFLDVNIVKYLNDTLGTKYSYTQYTMQAGVIPNSCTSAAACGVLGLSLFCPFTRCGWFGWLLGLCDSDC